MSKIRKSIPKRKIPGVRLDARVKFAKYAAEFDALNGLKPGTVYCIYGERITT